MCAALVCLVHAAALANTDELAWIRNSPWAASPAAVLAAHALSPLPILQPFALAVAIVLVSVFVPGPPTRRLGNLSYALFLIHFPVVQVLVHAGYAGAHPVVYLTMVLVTAGGSAMVLSRLMDWYLVWARQPRPVTVALRPSPFLRP